jgi:hypothetical protein
MVLFPGAKLNTLRRGSLNEYLTFSLPFVNDNQKKNRKKREKKECKKKKDKHIGRINQKEERGRKE